MKSGFASLILGLFALNAGAMAAQQIAAQANADALTVERVSTEPDSDLRGQTVRWSPDAARVAWLELVRPLPRAIDKTQQMEIRSFDADLGSSAAASATPRQPQVLVSAAKVTASLSGSDTPMHRRLDDDGEINPWFLRDFAWSRDHGSLLLIGAQSLAWLDLATGKSRILVTGDDPITSAALSPDGKTVAFARECSLFAISVAGGPPRTVARSPGKDICEGEPDWPYRNEFHLPRAFWWSPDSASIAWLETDDRKVAKYTLRSSAGEPRDIVYPKPGGELPIVHVLVKRLAGAIPTKIDLGPAQNVYLPRVSWLPNSHQLAIDHLDRFQHKLQLFLADTTTGKSRSILTEEDAYWINIAGDPLFLSDSKRFIWSSERDNFRHLYLFDTSGKQLARLTHGDWEVSKLNAVDEAKGRIYFTATEKSPLERHLYWTDLTGSGPNRVSLQDGTHQPIFSPTAKALVDCFSSHVIAPRLDLKPLADPGQTLATTEFGTSSLAESVQRNKVTTHHDEAPTAGPRPASSPADTKLPSLLPVEYFTLRLHMDAEAHAFFIKPPNFDPAKKYPVIVYLAGGPGEQLVSDAWAGSNGLWMQLMAQKGYIIFALDNHGTAGRGHFFEEPLHLRLSAQELVDQRDGLLYLSNLPWVDMTRLGVCGWGYGGYLAVHAVLDRPVPFRAGFAGAPVLDWHYYDAIFSERYLDDSVVHADGWDASTALENESPRFFKSSLMVAQGTADEFVHMENLLTLQDELMDQGKSADILLFPDRGHRIEDPQARLVLYRRMTDFFVKNL